MPDRRVRGVCASLVVVGGLTVPVASVQAAPILPIAAAAGAALYAQTQHTPDTRRSILRPSYSTTDYSFRGGGHRNPGDCFSCDPPIGDPGDIKKNAPTVVISHGYQPNFFERAGLTPTFPMEDLTSAIGQRFKQEGVQANVISHTWTEAWGDSGDTFVSGNPWSVQRTTKKAGHRLGGMLGTVLGQDYEQPIHLIGHSFGTYVNAHAANRLNKAGIQVDAFTTLDPAFLGSVEDASFFQDNLNPSPDVKWVDNYVANKRAMLPGSWISEKFDGAAPDGGKLVDANHVTIHSEFYKDTVVDEWRKEGFYFSPVLGDKGGYQDRPGPRFWQPDKATDDGGLNEGHIPYKVTETVNAQSVPYNIVDAVFREAFQTENGPDSDPLDVFRIYQNSPGFLSMNLTVPDDAEDLLFDVFFTKKGDGDKLTVTFKDTLLGAYRGRMFFEDTALTADLPISQFAGQTGLLEFKLHDNGGAEAEAYIHDIRYTRVAEVPAPATVTYLLPALGVLAGVGYRRRRRSGAA
jgi:pimeloyl-ACP methyl ester carboxylesterase